MSNIVEYALKMKDLASSQLAAFGARARTTFTNVSGLSNNLTSRNKIVSQSYDEIKARIREVENTIRTSTIPSQIRAARAELAKLQQQARLHPGNLGAGGSAGPSALTMGGLIKGNIIASAAMKGISMAGDAIGGFISDSVKGGLERQQIRTSFNVMTGSEQAGGDLTNQLVKLSKDTILGGEVFKNAQTMLAFGANSKEVAGDLKMLGDVAMGDKDRLSSLTLAFSQSRAAGKLMGQDLLQYVNAGFNPLEQIAQRTGKSMGQLRDEMSEGKISFSMIKQAFIDATSEGGKFNNMLDTIAKTPTGRLEQLKGQWDELKSQMGQAFMPLIEQGLKLAEQVMPLVEASIKPITNGIKRISDWIDSIKNGTSGWSDYLKTIGNFYNQHLLPVIKKLWDTISDIAIKTYKFYENSELAKDIFKTIYTVVGGVADLVGFIVDLIKGLFDNVIMPMVNAVEKTYRWIKGVPPPNEEKSPLMHLILPPKDIKDDKKDKENNSNLAEIARNTAENNKAGEQANKDIVSGGQKIINIHVGKFLDSITVNQMSTSESVSDIEKMLTEMFARIIYNTPQTNV